MPHALLSASTAHRWLNCPASVKLSEGVEDAPSPYAQAGTLAHAIGEAKARNYFFGPEEAASLPRLREDPAYTRDMEPATDAYLDYLKDAAFRFTSRPSVALELRVEYSDFVPGGYGTADCVMISPERLVIADYKNGAGVKVQARENPQLQLYALGALQTFRPLYGRDIPLVTLAIIQPHGDGVSEWDTTSQALRAWGEAVVRPAAARALSGEGDPTPGDWCRFCPVKARCPGRVKALLEVEPQVSTPPSLLSLDQVGDLLPRAKAAALWAKELEEFALSAALAGDSVPGWKVVPGRSSREWAGGTDAAFLRLKERGVEAALLYEQKPVSVAGLEKVLGKKAFKAYADLVETKPGKPSLVPDSDKRPAYLSPEAAFTKID